jgi:cytochrome b561
MLLTGMEVLPHRYSGIAMLLHWLVALLIAANFVLIYSAHQLPDDAQGKWIDLHMSIGLTVLGLVVLRLLWRAGHRPPPLPDYPPWERGAAHAVHAALYVVMLALPLSGWMHDSAWKDAPENPFYWFGLFEWPRIAWIRNLPPARKEVLHGDFLIAHRLFGYVLYALVTAHILGALKHQFLDRYPQLQRIVPASSRISEPAQK